MVIMTATGAQFVCAIITTFAIALSVSHVCTLSPPQCQWGNRANNANQLF